VTRTKIVRIVTASLVILVVVSGVVGEIRYGGLCSLDIWIISVTDSLGFLLRPLGVYRLPVTVTCPLGYLERALAARELLPQWWFSVVLVVLSVILLGRIFCVWICPTVLLRRVFAGNGGSQLKQQVASKGVRWASYSPYAVLGGVLLASFLFRFPVFCFFCPIGLFFGALYAVTRVFSPDPLGLELVILPLMLGIELWVLKSWCRSICPLGALLSIAGSLNRFLIPVVRKDKCLTSNGADCRVCERACPEGIELASIGRRLAPNSRTKCLECYAQCPGHAVEIAIFK
jgi:ferredoxin-type protein NapH